MIKYGSVCSGIEAASMAWEPIGFEPSWFAEIEPFPSAVLAHHWPSVPNMGDMTALSTMVRMGLIEAPDVLVGGTPCQAFSVAGKRGSLDDDRGQLSLSYVELLNAIDEQRNDGDECVAVWENVPGVLSTKDNAFGCFLAAIVGESEPLEPTGSKWGNYGVVIGPRRSLAWRVLDAQWFGVAQRRRRVFVVASARTDIDVGQVLFESDGVQRNTAPSREAWQDATAFTASSFGAWREGCGTLRANGGDYGGGGSENLVTLPIHDKTTRNADVTGRGSGNGLGIGAPSDPSPTLTAGDKHAGFFCGTTNDYMRDVGFEVSPTLRSGNGGGAVIPGVTEGHRMTAFGEYTTDETASTCKARDYKDATDLVTNPQRVRRLTPVECERLQGFPDNHTRIPYRNKPADQCPDGPRYKAIGNSKAVPVVRWIGERLKKELEQCKNY